MMKFMCVFVCAFAITSAASYGSRGSYGAGSQGASQVGPAQVGAVAYQVQPVWSVSHGPAPSNCGSQGGANGNGNGNNGNYGNNGGYAAAAPVAAAPNAYGRSQVAASAIDDQVLGLAKLALAAPSAGGPLEWNESPRTERITLSLGQSAGFDEQAQIALAAAAASSLNGYSGSSSGLAGQVGQGSNGGNGNGNGAYGAQRKY